MGGRRRGEMGDSCSKRLYFMIQDKTSTAEEDVETTGKI